MLRSYDNYIYINIIVWGYTGLYCGECAISFGGVKARVVFRKKTDVDEFNSR